MSITTVIPNGDGTGTQITYGDDGTITAREPVNGLNVPEPAAPVPSALDLLAEVGQKLASIPPTATSAVVRYTVREAGEVITEAITPT